MKIFAVITLLTIHAGFVNIMPNSILKLSEIATLVIPDSGNDINAYPSNQDNDDTDGLPGSNAEDEPEDGGEVTESSWLEDNFLELIFYSFSAGLIALGVGIELKRLNKL